MKIEREWAMPNRWTFRIEPIRELIEEEMDDGLWVDPFAGKSDLADVTNDINPKFDTDYNEDVIEFLNRFDRNSVDGVLFDPPYTLRQLKECYEDVGRELTLEETKDGFWTKCKDIISEITNVGGKVISFGYNSCGIGKTRGFEKKRILLVCHGGKHNDTICVVDVKEQSTLD